MIFSQKNMKSISTKVDQPMELESFRSYIGKKVIAKSGDKIGKVYNIRFSKNTVLGIVVRRRLSKFFIGIEFVKGVSDKSLMLSIDPVIMLAGKHVFDADGRRLGKVARIERKGSGNDFESIVVRKWFFMRGIIIPKKDIEVMKKNIILKKAYT